MIILHAFIVLVIGSSMFMVAAFLLFSAALLASITLFRAGVLKIASQRHRFN